MRRLHDIWTNGDVAAIPEIHAPGFVAHMPKGWGEPPGHRDGHDGIARAVARIRASFPDWREEVDRPPSGARVRVAEISIVGIAEQWCLNDDLAFFKQMDSADDGPRSCAMNDAPRACTAWHPRFSVVENRQRGMVGARGIEPRTSCVSSRRSYH